MKKLLVSGMLWLASIHVAQAARDLPDFAALVEKEGAANKRVKEAQKALEVKVKAKYAKLTEAEIKALVVDDKWLVSLAADVQSELDRVSRALNERIKELADRYSKPLPQIAEEVEALSAQVKEHLKKMGFAWN